MRLVTVREIGCGRPWLSFGTDHPLGAPFIVREAVAQDGRDPALQYIQYDNAGHWWPLVDEPGERDILARMLARLDSSDAPCARLEAVDELVEIGLTVPEAWRLVWQASPVEPADAAAGAGR